MHLSYRNSNVLPFYCYLLSYIFVISFYYREYLLSSAVARQGKVQFFVESAGSSQCGIYRVDPVGRPYYYDLGIIFKTVHQSQEGGDHAGVNKILPTGSHGRETVDFVEKNDARFRLLCLEEEPIISSDRR